MSNADPNLPGDLSRRQLLATAAALGAAQLLPACGPTPAGKAPNVLFVLADAHRAISTGCYGDTDAVTPHIDRLADEGVRLTTAVSNTPVCRPYRASVMTGALGHHSGLVGNWSPHSTHDTVSHDYVEGTLPRGHQWTPGELPTMGAIFRSAGYRCGYVGKWHLGRVDIDPGPLRMGFLDGWAVSSEPAHEYWDWRYYTGAGPAVTGQGRFKPSVDTDLALEFIAGDDERPWMLFLSWGGPHKPFEAPQEFRHFQGARPLPNVTTGVRADLPGYLAMVQAIDNELGRLLAGLQTAGAAQDTLVVYTSDHGTLLGSHGYGGKELPYDGASRIPFIARWPGHLGSGQTLSTPLCTPDILPTLSGLAGVPCPAVPDGIDLSAQLLGAPDPRDSVAIYLAGYAKPAAADKPTWRGLRTETHLYACTAAGPWMLYDLANDPYELDNLVDSNDPLVAEFHGRTLQTMKTLGDVWLD